MKYIVSLFTAFVLLTGCKSDTASPKGTVNAFFEAMKKGDIETVKKLITKSDLSFITMAEGFSKMAGKEMDITEKMKSEFIEKSKNVSFNIKDEKIEGDKADVTVEIKENEKTTSQVFKLLKEEGNWKLSLMSTGMNMAGKDGNMHNENINIADSLKKGMEQLQNLNMDSVSGKMKEGLEKLKELQQKNPEAMKKMEEAMKKMQEAAEKMKQ